MSYWHITEIFIIAIVVFYQIYHTVGLHKKITKFKKIFSSKLYVEKTFVDKQKVGEADFDSDDYSDDESTSDFPSEKISISLVDTNGFNQVILRIRRAINTYLINNYGAAVNFSIIKDIIDREVDVKDEEINQGVTLPLYLGLAATMIGIIFGLFSMPNFGSSDFSSGIGALIDGVKVAMIGSLSGLALTTFLSSFVYKNAKRVLQEEKNEQISLLQAKLLPELIKAEDTGVSGLKASLDRFARVATDITDNVLFAATQTGENLELQNEVIEKIENINVLKVSKWNLELFEKLENNMDSLSKFSSYLVNMERITSQLSEFASRTTDIEKVVTNIDNNLSESRKLTKFLANHFEKIENSGEAMRKTVGLVEAQIEDSINQLKKSTEAMFEDLFKHSGIQEEKLELIYKNINQNISAISGEYVTRFKEAYEDSIPRFEQLDNLALIKDIGLTVSSIKHNNDLLHKLNSIEALLIQLAKKTSAPRGPNLGNSNHSPIGATKKKTLFGWLPSPFKRRKKG